MQIRSLAIAKRPVWFDVPGGRLQKFVIRARKRFWPEGMRGTALFLFEFTDEVDTAALAEHRITRSGIGYYVYLQADGPSDSFEQTVSLPAAGLKRIGMRLWNSHEPVLLEDIEIEAIGGSLSSEHSVRPDIVLGDPARFPELCTGLHPLGLNLMTSHPGCTGRCHSITQHWYDTMDEGARQHPDDRGAGRTNCLYAAGDGTLVPVAVFHLPLAMLRIPQSIEAYFDQIGDKSRNMVRKAQRLGYVYRQVDPDQHLDDVLAIRTSSPRRQGKPIPEYFKIRPASVIEDPFRSSCAFHGEEFYGIFKDERLVAYSTIFYYGELGQVNHILGHADHLNEGVMNLLMHELVGQVIRRRPWVKAINFRYMEAREDGGVGLFKQGVGFSPETVLVTQSAYDLNKIFPGRPAESCVQPAAAPSARKVLKGEATRALRAAVIGDTFIRPERVKSRADAVDLALRTLGESQAQLKTIRYRASADEIRESDFDMAAHAIVFDGLSLEDYADFLSAQLKGLRKRVPKDSFVLFDFKRAPAQDHAARTRGLARFVPPMLRGRDWRVNQSLTEYLSRRFKSLDMSVNDVKLGFKGSDYVVAGLIDFEHKRSYRSFDSLLILRKIR